MDCDKYLRHVAFSLNHEKGRDIHGAVLNIIKKNSRGLPRDYKRCPREKVTLR